ncbi:MAG: PKD domain-containing protein [Bacteroidota bacterium]
MKHFHSYTIDLPAFFQLILIGLLLIPGLVTAQLSHGGKPEMTDLNLVKSGSYVIELPAPDPVVLNQEDLYAAEAGMPERMGVNIPVNISMANNGVVVKTTGLAQTWVSEIICNGAVGIGLYFSYFSLPSGGRMFVYSEDKTHVLGAYTSQNNQADGQFAIEVVKGDRIIIEYMGPVSESDEPAFVISEVLYVYKPMIFPGTRSLKQTVSGDCEVNAACSEGDNWRNEIKSVVRILIKNGNASYWCSGAVLNNTAADFSPLLLTADHCARSYSGSYVNPVDLSKWIFYFLYETSGCEFEVVQDNKTLTGAVKLASSSPQGNNGSDFYLLLLNDQIPASYSPFYAGWSRTGELSGSGVGIHHPMGDVRKISTYTSTLSNDQWGQFPGTHFRVVWSETENGHGVTEGGSSGSPVFDDHGRVIGQLTGGESGCSNLTGPDFYGKLAYSWESNGTHDSTRLKPWLDPDNTSRVNVDGISYVVNFKADTNTIPVGRSVNFTDLSTVSPNQWQWNFIGGEPEYSTDANPTGIVYRKIGKFPVKLTVSNESGNFSVVREDFIKVLPIVLFDVEDNNYKIIIGPNNSQMIHVTISDMLGRNVKELENFCPGQSSCNLNLTGLRAGMYFITVTSDGYRETSKIIYRNQ